MKAYTAQGYEWRSTQLARFIDRYGYSSLERLQEGAVGDPETFWAQLLEALEIAWEVPPERMLDESHGIMWPRWFVGGRLDLVDNLVGRHARAAPGKPAIRWEGDTGELRTLTYATLAEEVERLACGLCALGVGEGDRIALYLPMVPEAVVTMLAAARLGAIFIPFFSGYGTDSVVQRLRDCEATVLVCADGFYRRGKAVPMLATAREAAAACPTLRHLVVVDRLGRPRQADRAGGVEEIAYGALRACAGRAESRAWPADQPLMLMYTSGTTGRPKAVVHSHGGFPLKAAQDLMMAFDLGTEDTLMWITDMGWLMGPWLAFGSLLRGATMVLYEGTPDHPDPSRLWRLVHRHRVTHLGLSPSLVRLLMAADAPPPAPALIESLRLFGSTGEAWNEAPWVWLFEAVGRARRPIVNYSGGTEIGGGILASFPGLAHKPGGFSGPIPGMAADVLDAAGRPVRGEVGELVLRRPWPGMTHGFWRDDARYLEAYWSTWPQLWVHGDWVRIDADGQWFVHGRSDDTIKIAGKRVGPADFESALVAHPLVAEAVAIGVPDALKGETVVCFVTLADAAALADRPWADWEEVLRRKVARSLGKPLAPARIHHLEQLPKTRNGKIVRRVMRAAYLGGAPGDLSALENPAAIDAVARLRPADEEVA